MKKERKMEVLGQDAGLLSLCEMGLGSLLHSFKIPLSGHFLSLNQIFLLSRSTFQTQDPRAGAIISGIAAVLKSLSPAGKKLTPMLAISAQGLLFSLAPLFMGPYLLPALLGAALASLWAFAQPLLIYYFIFGRTLFLAVETFYQKMQDTFSFLPVNPEALWPLIAAAIALKIILAMAVVILARTLSDSAFARWQKKLLLSAPQKARSTLLPQGTASLGQNMRLAWKDLMNPLFFLSLILTLFFFLYAEASFGRILWHLLRPIAVGFLLFLAVRSLPLEKWARRFPVFLQALEKVRGQESSKDN